MTNETQAPIAPTVEVKPEGGHIITNSAGGAIHFVEGEAEKLWHLLNSLFVSAKSAIEKNVHEAEAAVQALDSTSKPFLTVQEPDPNSAVASIANVVETENTVTQEPAPEPVSNATAAPSATS